MNVSDFAFGLPDELIAQAPPAERGASRLLAMERDSGRVADRVFADLPLLLGAGDVIVVNDTRVFPARLLGRRLPGGGAAECLLVGPAGRADEWLALVHPGQRLRAGSRMVFESAQPGSSLPALTAEVVGLHFHGRRTVRLWTDDGSPVWDAIERLGHVPLPPYIRRPDAAADRERYQTVYARERGSVAAPTAGLHFTPELLAELSARGVERVAVTLHVGYGTFQPVRVARAEDHVVEPESYEVTPMAAAALTRARAEARRIVAVGTTTTRALESLSIGEGGDVRPGRGLATLSIRPGHEFKLVSGLITNLHLPQSSLLMLVCAFGGREAVLAAYRHAVAHRYRFYSYGDAMLIV